MSLPEIGRVYRHFKHGEYFLVSGIASGDLVIYSSLESGITYVRPSSEWFDGVIFKAENETGQATRFELVKDFSNPVGAFSTEELVQELTTRPDSPFAGLDVDQCRSTVFMEDFVTGVLRHEVSPETGEQYRDIQGDVYHRTLEDAKSYLMKRLPQAANHTILKRLFVLVDFDE